MDEDRDVSLSRALWALRRRWWIVAAAATFGGVLALVALGGRGIEEGTRLVVIDNSQPLASVDIQTDSLIRAVTLRPMGAALGSDETRRSISSAVGRSIATSVVTDESTKSVSLTVSGPTADAVTRASSLLVAKAREIRGAEVSRTVDGLRAPIAALRIAADARLKELDADLLAVTDSQSALADVLRSERAAVGKDLVSVQVKSAALETYVSSAADSVQVLAGKGAQRAGGRATSLVLGLIGGGVLALLGAFTAGWWDRTVRSLGDIERLGATEVLGVIGTKRTRHRDLGGLCAVIRNSSRDIGPRCINLAGVDEYSDVTGLHAELSAELKGQVNDLVLEQTDPWSMAPDAVLRAADVGATLLVAAFGRTHIEDVVAAARDIKRSGGVLLGVVIDGVPKSDARRAVK